MTIVNYLGHLRIRSRQANNKEPGTKKTDAQASANNKHHKIFFHMQQIVENVRIQTARASKPPSGR